MIKLKSKKILFALLGFSTILLPIAVVSCTAPTRPDRSDKSSATIVSRKTFTPNSTPIKDKDGKDLTGGFNYLNSAFASLFAENGTTIAAEGVNEALWNGIDKAAKDYNEFRRIHTPSVDAKYVNSLTALPNDSQGNPITQNDQGAKKPTWNIPVLHYLDNYVTGYFNRFYAGTNVFVVNGKSQEIAIKSFYYELVNVDKKIASDNLRVAIKLRDYDRKHYGTLPKLKEGETADKYTDADRRLSKDEEKKHEKAIEKWQNAITRIDNIVIVAIGFDPSKKETIYTYKYKEATSPEYTPGSKDRTEIQKVENQNIPDGHWIKLDPGTYFQNVDNPAWATAEKQPTQADKDKYRNEQLYQWIGETVYNVIMDLDSKPSDYVVLNKGTSADGKTFSEVFGMGTKSITLMPQGTIAKPKPATSSTTPSTTPSTSTTTNPPATS